MDKPFEDVVLMLTRYAFPYIFLSNRVFQKGCHLRGRQRFVLGYYLVAEYIFRGEATEPKGVSELPYH